MPKSRREFTPLDGLRGFRMIRQTPVAITYRGGPMKNTVPREILSATIQPIFGVRSSNEDTFELYIVWASNSKYWLSSGA